MADLFDYLHWRGDLSFSQCPVNSVDALIFSALSYIDFGGSVEALPEIPISLREASEEFFKLPDVPSRCRTKTDPSLLMAAAETSRFGNAMILQFRSHLIPEEETQFAAMTFLLDDNSGFIAFRGTDYSLTGWKEDFNMSFRDTIPSQLLALEYTREVGSRYIMPLRLGGHSKGGNLAVFSAVKAEADIRSRILNVYSMDGPGFTDYVMSDPVYKEIASRIQTIVPQSSVIGMLLEHEEPYTIIKSKQLGLLQHELYSWEVDGPRFVPMEEITADSRFVDQTIKTWFAGMSNEERNEIVDTIFDLLALGDVDNVLDILQPKNLKNYIRTLATNGKIRKMLSDEFLSLMEAAKKTQLALDAAQKKEAPDDTEAGDRNSV
jgi:hypothetical protein